VAIDGPSGVGKSTVSKELARRLGVPVLDTGATYRAASLAVLRAGVDPKDRDEALKVALEAEIEVREDGRGSTEVLLDGEVLGQQIRTPEVDAAASVVSAYPEVRRRLVELQRKAGERMGAVVEGRDIGTVVFPDTPHKFFLDARPEIRAGRRHHQLEEGDGETPSFDEVKRELERRDDRDRSRDDSPLQADKSYTVIDTSELAPEEVVERMLAQIRA